MPRRSLIVLVVLSLLNFAGNLMADETKPAKARFLDPEIVDNACYNCVGKAVGKCTANTKLGISEIPYWDAALDKFGKVSPLYFELGFTLASKYMWRGQTLGNDISWQPYVKSGHDFGALGNPSFTYWVNITNDYKGGNGKDNSEYDFIFDYNVDVLKMFRLVGLDGDKLPYLLKKSIDINFDTGYIYYYFPPYHTDTKEVYWKIGYNWPLHPYMLIINDIDAGRGIWYEWGVCQDIDLSLFKVCTYAKLGYNKNQWISGSALQTLDFGGSIPFPIGKHMTIKPFLSYSKRLHRTYPEGSEDVITHDELYGGFSYSVNF